MSALWWPKNSYSTFHTFSRTFNEEEVEEEVVVVRGGGDRMKTKDFWTPLPQNN